MPRPGPRKPAIAIRLSAPGIDAIDRRARERKVTRSAMLRLLIGYALRSMPADWSPPHRPIPESPPPATAQSPDGTTTH